jgi:hypothetical protein
MVRGIEREEVRVREARPRGCWCEECYVGKSKSEVHWCEECYPVVVRVRKKSRDSTVEVGKRNGKLQMVMRRG